MRVAVVTLACCCLLGLGAPNAAVAGTGALGVPEEVRESAALLAYVYGDAFAVGGGTGWAAHGIAVRELDGTAPRILTDTEEERADGDTDAGVGVGDPAWSPDRRWVAFTLQQRYPHPWEVRIVPADGSAGDRLLVSGATSLSFSPDGTRVAYVQHDAEAGSAHVVVAAFEVTASGPATRDPVIVATDAGIPVWHPSGASLAVVRGYSDPDGPGTLWRVAADGGDLRPLTRGVDVNRANHERPAWSPDGSAVAFLASRPGGDPKAYAVDGDGSGLRDLAPKLPFVTDLDWHPSGRFLVVSVGGGLFLAPADGDPDGLRSVIEDGPSALYEVRFTPDGASLVYVADNPGESTQDVYTLPTVGGQVRRITDDGHATPYGAQVVSSGLTSRVAGPDRIATAAALSRRAFERSRDVVIVRADVYADALVASPLAGSLDAPLLLTSSTGIPAVVAAEVRRLGAVRAHLVGGTSALGAQVERDLENLGLSVQRVSGTDRFSLAASIAERLGGAEVYLVQGISDDPARGWPDAVSVSALAAHRATPILLTTDRTLPAATAAAIRRVRPATVTVVGGTAAVSEDVAEAVTALGPRVRRLAGPTRYETSRAVVDEAVRLGLSSHHPVLVTGRNWPDSLAAGPAAARLGGVTLLVDGHGLGSSPAARWIDARAGSFREVVIAGGSAAVRPIAAVEAEHLASPRP